LLEPEQERQRESDAERGRQLLLGGGHESTRGVDDEPSDDGPKPWNNDRRVVSAIVLTCLVIAYLLARGGGR
jgi:hypothetical protein